MPITALHLTFSSVHTPGYLPIWPAFFIFFFCDFMSSTVSLFFSSVNVQFLDPHPLLGIVLNKYVLQPIIGWRMVLRFIRFQGVDHPSQTLF
jgi:hypothetical protein